MQNCVKNIPFMSRSPDSHLLREISYCDLAAIPGGDQPCYDEQRDGFTGRCKAENCCEGRYVISGLCPDYPNNFKCCFRRNICASGCGKCIHLATFILIHKVTVCFTSLGVYGFRNMQ